MKHTSFVSRSASAFIILFTLASTNALAQQSSTGNVDGTILNDGKPVAGASVHIVRLDGDNPSDVMSDAAGHFVGAARRRVNPMALQVGVRVEF